MKNNYFREPINGFTHLFGAILSLVALIAMLIKVTTLNFNIGLALTSAGVFGISLILLYSASATYHLVRATDNTIAFLRRLDHSMIFILIGGTYIPFCLLVLQGTTRIIFTSIIILLTVAGILFKMVWFSCPRWLSTSIYIGMGWFAIFLISPLYHEISLAGVLWLVAGGVAYTIGGVIYAIKPKFLEFKYLGFHEIFHLFILAGSLFHFVCVYFYVFR
ncbi:MAG: PAQR family membrane homeostasis protein TrhA [Sarcina sp.]